MSSSSQQPVVPHASEASSNQASVSAQEHADTQRSLQQATVALEVASNRIRQVRRSLLQLSESLPNAEDFQRFRPNYNDIRPGHEALVLSGDESNGASTIPSGARQTRSNDASTFHNTTFAVESTSAFSNDAETNTIAHAFPEAPQSPLNLNYRYSTSDPLSNHEQYRENHRLPDSAATTRGLRVAAREAELRQEATAASVSWSRDHRNDATNAILIAPAVNPRPEDERVGLEVLAYADQAPRTREAYAQHARRTMNGPSLPPNTFYTSSRRPPDPRRWRRPAPSSSIFATDTRNDAVLEAGGSGMLPPQFPNAGLQSYSRHVHRLEALALPPRNSSDNSVQTRVPGSLEQHRFYQEMMSAESLRGNFSPDWSEDELFSWMHPQRDERGPNYDYVEPRNRRDQANQQSVTRQNMDSLRQHIDSIRITRTTNTDVSPPEAPPPRRAWARLDADGNEISPTEEEELERSRTEYRLRALQRARQDIAAAQNGRPEFSARGLLNPVTGQRTMHGSVLDATFAVQEEGRQRPLASSAYTPLDVDARPIHVDPLPMPLTSMISMSDSPKEEDIYVDILFPKHACLAGR